MSDSPVRIDAWLWAVRQFKTALRGDGRVPCRTRARQRRAGEGRAAGAPRRRGAGARRRLRPELVVRQTLVKRVSAAVAATAVEDRTPPPPAARGGRRSCRSATAGPGGRPSGSDATSNACAGAERRTAPRLPPLPAAGRSLKRCTRNSPTNPTPAATCCGSTATSRACSTTGCSATRSRSPARSRTRSTAGSGLAGELVAFAVDDVEATSDRRIVPSCWYVGEWFDRHPDRAGLLDPRTA